MTALKDFFSVSIEIQRIWGDLPRDEACYLFDRENLSVNDIRQSCGTEAAEYYKNWICRRIP